MTKIFIAVAFAIPTLSAVGIAQTQRFLPPTPASPDPFVSRDTTTVLAQDFDGDGRPDLFFANTDGPSQLLRNVGPWRFAQIGASVWSHENRLIGSMPSPCGVTFTAAPHSLHSYSGGNLADSDITSP